MKQFCMMALAGLLVVGCQEVPKGYVINGVNVRACNIGSAERQAKKEEIGILNR